MVALHGGHLEARSEQGQWAEFSLEIPQPLPENPAAPPPADL
jgi:signal transduction histidine kinase